MAPSKGHSPSIGQRNQNPGVRALLVCALVSVALLIVGATGSGVVSGVRGIVQTLTLPVRELGSIVASPFVGMSNILTNLTSDQQTLLELREENERLRTRNIELEEAAQDTQRLQELLNLKSAYDLESKAVRIISGSSDSWSRNVTIDKGEESGLTVNMPVTGSAGVIGQIVDTSANTSTVRLITDETSSVAAMVQSSRAHGMLQGSVSGELHLELVSTDLSVEVGDVIVTSGLGGVFPKGLPLGLVKSVEASEGALYYTIVVEPFAHASSLEEVLVITSLKEDQTATAEDIAEADAQEMGTFVSEDETYADDEEGTEDAPLGVADADADAAATDATASAEGGV